jgi:hypothetical protein
VLDNFNRSNGPIGGSWLGQATLFSIKSKAVAPVSSSALVTVWGPTEFGPEQEAYMKLTTIASSALEHGLLLKVQGTDASAARLDVRYDAIQRRVLVSTYAPGTGWLTHASIARTFVAGDQLGVRALANGYVEVFRNRVRLAVVAIQGWPHIGAGGRIGIASTGATSSRFDDFGGGNLRRPTLSFAATESPDVAPSEPLFGGRVALSEARPNPSRAGVEFELELPRAASVSFSVHDLQGRTIWSGTREETPGRALLKWDGADQRGGPAPAGVYLMRVSIEGQAITRRFVMLR